ncbi:nuclease-related domain-containing protein [Paracidovorax valerianellae]|uniref:Nuclease-related domain-containing protein n=1 Tax=Paracidovorax valerianellae TaxID=187868 RepID=A0A1G7C2Q5_9BURK|nr:nuclease-related domain-containing protein [Paracidovorax valerianellae]MDA8446587.1 NERD domain-containing protein [Paracidovorax valerianellae]SDE33644.1 Nuclease-related domain-containing protein [Paracidovorax valerianellae]
MLIKSAQDRSEDIEALEALMRHPQATAQIQAKIDGEIRMIRAGAKTEKDAAYVIEFDHRASQNWAVIHDLRIEHKGRVAQIDHLLINRLLEIWVCESKSFHQGVAVNEVGEFTSFFAGSPRGIPSPIEQNRRHILVLQSLLKGAVVPLPKRFGVKLMPRFESAVLISQNARITRPKKPFAGLETVMKNDQLRSAIDRQIDNASGLAAMLSMWRVVGPETLEQFARSIAKLHRPLAFDWPAKFGLPKVPSVSSAAPVPPEPYGAAQPVQTLAVQEPEAVYHAGPERAAARVPGVGTKPQSQALPRADSARPSAAMDGLAAQQPVLAANAGKSDKNEKLPTSKLARKWGLTTAAGIERLQQCGYLEPREAGDLGLTSKARAIGAVHVERGPHSPYFLWPANLDSLPLEGHGLRQEA